MKQNLVSFLDLLNNVQWRNLVKKKQNKEQQLMSYWLENKCINNQCSSKIQLLLTFWCTTFIILCKKNDHNLANSRFQTKLKLIRNWANYAYLKINALNPPLTEIIFTDINHVANKVQNKYQWLKISESTSIAEFGAWGKMILQYTYFTSS